ncbi:branched-chain amino acid ABC transporter substrate-binding protein [Bordetella ansorpii]|uniref:Branched-chain amino acid ABC transporter substrate-binding protein n=1 Tax=Bordetella ansorpii TaxID=288768 RepID=A0A157S4V6_9BORD|nr:branched-chain amino acid ABC transporter substrate-binding protein [Bordetella ansorpii]SAI65434.1 branched-chain amino acid ABC transporter substrate-binding protein [Bordetella ansorpii]
MKKFDLCTLAGACALAALWTLPAAADPVKIGLVETLSGPQASSGQAYRTAVRYVVDQINAAGGWNGEPVQLLEYDNQGGPSGAADKLRAAAADGVHLIVQGASSAIGGQITEDVRKHNLRNPGKEMVYINMGAEALELTGEKCSFYHFRFASNAEVRTRALVQGMKQAGALGGKVYAINQNYSWGQDMERAIVANAQAGGYTVVAKTLHDVNKIQDFAPYVSRIAASGADTVLTGNWSNDLLLLMKASKAAGLKARYGTVYLDQPGNLANAGELALGNFVVHTFNADAGGEDAARFVADYRAKTGAAPVFIEPQTVYGMMMVADALKRTKAKDGKLVVNDFAKALESARIQTPMGEMSMRAEDHQAQMPMVVSVVSRDATLKVDGTDMGFKSTLRLSAQQAATPPQASCQMKRPG